MNDAINEAMFEWAFTIKRLLESGWTLGKLNYSSARLGIGPSLVISKDGKDVICYDPSDVENIIRNHHELETSSGTVRQ